MSPLVFFVKKKRNDRYLLFIYGFKPLINHRDTCQLNDDLNDKILITQCYKIYQPNNILWIKIP